MRPDSRGPRSSIAIRISPVAFVFAAVMPVFAVVTLEFPTSPASATPPQGEEHAAVSAYEAVAVTDGGTLTGFVRGPAPELPAPDAIVTKDKSLCGDRKPSEAMIRGADGGLKNSVVFLDGISKGKPIDTALTLKLDNHLCGFQPHVLAVAVGQRLEISNSDPILHNSHAYLDGTRTIFNIALPVQNQRVPKTIREPGLMRVQCDAGHTWMVAYVYSFHHPYFAVTDEKGAFRIDQIPPGTYRVSSWHETLGVETREVTITAGQDAQITFEHPAKPALR